MPWAYDSQHLAQRNRAGMLSVLKDAARWPLSFMFPLPAELLGNQTVVKDHFSKGHSSPRSASWFRVAHHFCHHFWVLSGSGFGWGPLQVPLWCCRAGGGLWLSWHQLLGEHAANTNIVCEDSFVQWEFQDPKMEVLYHIRPLICWWIASWIASWHASCWAFASCLHRCLHHETAINGVCSASVGQVSIGSSTTWKHHFPSPGRSMPILQKVTICEGGARMELCHLTCFELKRWQTNWNKHFQKCECRNHKPMAWKCDDPLCIGIQLPLVPFKESGLKWLEHLESSVLQSISIFMRALKLRMQVGRQGRQYENSKSLPFAKHLSQQRFV